MTDSIDIDRGAPVVCEVQININANPDQCWAVLANFDNWANWNEQIAYARLSGPVEVGSVLNWSTRGWDIHSTFIAVEPSRRLVWEGVHEGLKGIHSFEFTARGDNTLLVHSESFSGGIAETETAQTRESLQAFLQVWSELLKEQAEASAVTK